MPTSLPLSLSFAKLLSHLRAMALVLLFLLLTSFTVFAEELYTLPPISPPPPHTPSPLHPPIHSPHHPPHHHHHTPASTPVYPPVHFPPPPHHTPSPLHPPTHSPHHPPHHHHPPASPPVYPPVHSPPPTHAPAKPPTHHHTPPTPAKPPTHHHYPPTPPAPAKPPTHSHYPPTPVKPPPPPHTPVVHHPLPRTFIAVQGVVYVKSCKYAGVDTLLGATPLLGAVVKFQCNNTKYKLVQPAKTDKNGYFFLEAPKTITTYGVHKCKVVLVSAPNGLKPSNLNGGVTGSILRPQKPYVSQKLPFLLYTVGPLAFEPKCPVKI